MNNVELVQYIRSTLGDPAVDVELSTPQIQRGIDLALREWSRRHPVEKLLLVNVTVGVTKYDLSGVTGIRGVLYARDQPLTTNFMNGVEFDIFRDRIWAMPVMDVSDLAAESLYLDDLRNMTGTEFDWIYDPSTKQLYITPSPVRSYQMLVIYAKNPTVDEATLSYDWVTEYSLAYAKTVLGQIRRKHGNKIPGKEIDIELDGPSLLQEGKEEMRSLKEQLEQLGPDATPPTVG